MVKLANASKPKKTAKSVAQQKALSKKKAQQNVHKMGDAAAYKAALTRPFSLEAGGARVTDLYCTPTVARTIKRTFTLQSGSAGTFDMVFLPHPSCPIFSPRGSIVSGVQWWLADNPATQVANGRVDTLDTQLAAELATYRVVSCGIKISATCTGSQTSGLVVMGTVPFAGSLPYSNTVGGQLDNAGPASTIGDWLNDNGIPSTNGTNIDTSQVPNMAKAQTYTTQTLETSSLQIVPRITSPEAFRWRKTKDSSFGFDTVDQTSLSYIISGDAGYLDCSGFEAVVVAGTGLVASTPIFTVETIFHVEGVAKLSTSSLNAEANKPSPVNWSGFVDAMSSAAQSPAVQLIASSAVDSLKTSLMALLL